MVRVGASSAALVIAMASMPAFAQTDPNQSGTTPQPDNSPRGGDVTGNQADPNANPAVPTTGSATTQNANGTSATNDDVVVTGTLFRRTNTETPSPVSTLSAANLDQRGLTSVAEAVQTIAAGNGGGVPQGFQNGFAAGAQAISLRGLTSDSTLTVFDGLRAAPYPLADDGARSFVDLNTIPQAIVDRIEVLRDGASSTYGADAIAGVVNVILKKEITGVQGRVEGGISERGDRPNQRAQLTAGYGKLDEQGFNFYVSGEYQHEGALYNKQRGFPYNTANLTSVGGANGNFGYTPPSAASTSGATVAIVRPSTLTTPGNILTGVGIAGGQFQVLGQGGCAANGLTAHTNGSGTYCEQDLTNTYGQILPDQERFGGTAHLTVNVGSKAQAYLVGTYYQSHVTIGSTPASLRSSNPINTVGISLPALLANGTVNPQDPFANIISPTTGQRESALIYYRFGDIAQRSDQVEQSYRVAGGIDGTFGDNWGYSVAGTYMKNQLDTTRTGYLNLPGLQNAITTGSYNFINPSLNTQAVRDAIAPIQRSSANSELALGQVTITKELFQLPGGPLQVGVGGQVRYESIYAPNADNPLVTLGINTFQAVGHRDIEAGYFEINAPIFDQLEINGSGRYDHYSTGFDHFSPKIGAKFTPIPQLSIRGTYSEGFRAPSIPETSGAVIGFVPYTPGQTLSATDKATLLARYGNSSYITNSYSLGLFTTGNPNLKPETSRSFTGGVVVQPRPWLSFTVDYYNIHKDNLIIQGIGANAGAADQYLLTGNPGAGLGITQLTADPANPSQRALPFSVNSPYANGTSLQTSGIDAQLQATIPLSSGVKFTSILEGTEVLEYKVNNNLAGASDPTQIYSYVGTLGSYNISSASGTPRWRANWQNSIETGPFNFNATTYFTSGYKGYADDNTGAYDHTCDAAVAVTRTYLPNLSTSTAGGPLQCTVRHFIDVDLTGQMKVNDKFTFYVNVINLLDAKAPFDPNTYGGTNYNPAWSTAGVIGRTYRAGATFKF
jgi:iron complex outermembrane receptor protein